MPVDPDMPTIAELLAPIFARVPVENRPLLIALAERTAAKRYRTWAESSDGPARSQLLCCARREAQIATRVEELFREAAAIQTDLLAANPELEGLSDSLFSGRPVHEQYAIQASAERAGAATWRAFARSASEVERAVYLECAELEEASAEALEEMLASGEEVECGERPQLGRETT